MQLLCGNIFMCIMFRSGGINYVRAWRNILSMKGISGCGVVYVGGRKNVTWVRPGTMRRVIEWGGGRCTW